MHKQIKAVIDQHPGDGGVIYAQTRKEVETIASKLQQSGVKAVAYHAGLAGDVRARAQDDFVNERCDVVVATVAFGMGIDRSNVRFVIHANTPKSVEHYQQEAGRAGRDGLPADCVLLTSASDLVKHRQLATMDGPISPQREAALNQQLSEIGRYAVAPVCRHKILSEHFGATLDHDNHDKGCGACDVCLGETALLPTAEALTIAQKIISAVWRTGGRFGIGHIVSVLRGHENGRMAQYGHDQLTVYGILSSHHEKVLKAWCDQLIVQGFLSQVVQDRFPIVAMTPEGKALCKGEGELRLSIFAELQSSKSSSKSSGKASSKSTTTAKSSNGLSVGQKRVFETLRGWRKQRAEQLGVPPTWFSVT